MNNIEFSRRLKNLEIEISDLSKDIRRNNTLLGELISILGPSFQRSAVNGGYSSEIAHSSATGKFLIMIS